MLIKIDSSSKTPIYKQLVSTIKSLIQSKILRAGDELPSMNKLSSDLDISKETIKKAYYILRDQAIIDSAHGKGFYVSNAVKDGLKVFVLFDFISTYKKELFQSFTTPLAQKAEFVIRLFNQDIDLFEKFIFESLGQFDYYVITPHLPLSKEIQKRVINVLKKIPNRQLIILDRYPEELKGNYIAVFQDFENDIYEGLEQALPSLKKYSKLNVYTMQGSLYGSLLERGIQKFCSTHDINYEIYKKNTVPDIIHKDESYFILNGQLDQELIDIVKIARKQKLKIGRDIGLLSYNESPINEIILDGLSVMSTDFKQMGSMAAQLILEDKSKKIKCDFNFIKRNTF